MAMRLRNIDINKIIPNEDNPRGIDIEHEDEKLSYLKDSIKRFGVMVPIVVTPRRDRFFLIDGERRYWAAKAVGLDRLPAYVLTAAGGKGLPTRDLLLRMFQIHHLREQWGPVQQCAALEDIYQDIVENPELLDLYDTRASLKKTVEELAARTGIDDRTALDRIKFLRWPDDIKDELYDNPGAPGYSYILEIEDKIIIPAVTNYPEYFEVVDVDDVRRDLFRKLEHGLGHAQEVRQVAPYFRAKLSRPSERKAVLAVLKKMQASAKLSYEDARVALEKALPGVTQRDPLSPRRLISLMESLCARIEEFDSSSIARARGRSRASAEDIEQAIDVLVESLTDLRSVMDDDS